ncbi:UNVERIFIED_CONTAM: 8-oxo-dGTP diphosphatase [Acetivibrio alkalicellulosi]
MKHYEVTAAILVNNHEILCMQRGISKYDYISYKFEFPGGKVEKGETREESLKRELVEELGLFVEVKPENHFVTVEHTYPDFMITMHSYICYTPNRKINRKEHISEIWLKTSNLSSLDWAEADIPIVNRLMDIKL